MSSFFRSFPAKFWMSLRYSPPFWVTSSCLFCLFFFYLLNFSFAVAIALHPITANLHLLCSWGFCEMKAPQNCKMLFLIIKPTQNIRKKSWRNKYSLSCFFRKINRKKEFNYLPAPDSLVCPTNRMQCYYQTTASSGSLMDQGSKNW